MDFSMLIFFVAFVLFMILFFLQVLNLFKLGELYLFRYSFIVFCSELISFLFIFTGFLVHPTNTMVNIIYSLSLLMLPFTVIMLFTDAIFLMLRYVNPKRKLKIIDSANKQMSKG